MKRTILWIVIALILTPAFVFASSDVEDEGGPATVKWMMRWDNARVEAVAMPVIDTYQEQNPEITIEFENIGKGSDYYTKLNTLVAAGDMPDVTYLAPHYVSIFAANNGYVDEIETTDVQRYEQEMISFMESNYSDVLSTLAEKKAIDDELEGKIKAALDEFKGQFVA